MDDAPNPAELDWLEVDLLFGEAKPTQDDLLLLAGFRDRETDLYDERLDFGSLEDLGIEQVDDFWGLNDPLDLDVVVWMYPLIGDEVVWHEDGPFDGLRFDYSVLRSPPSRIYQYLYVVARFTDVLPVRAIYRTRKQDLGTRPDFTIVAADAAQIVKHWRDQGIEPGSDAALRINY